MRRSSSGSCSRLSLLPVRIKNDGSAIKPRGSLLSLGATASSLCGRLSYSSRSSYGNPNRPSCSNRPSYSNRASYSNQASLNNRKSARPSTSANCGGVPTKKRCVASIRHSGIIKDPRPVSKRAFREQMIRQLVQFLIDHKYPHPISPKLLNSPTSKDFTCIFEFLVSCLLPRYKLTKRIQDEVPRMLKLFMYPLTITKSAMCSMSSPLTWPTMLAALSWLQQLIDYGMQINVEDTVFPKTDAFDTSYSERLFAYCENSYREFLSGADQYDVMDSELAAQVIGDTDEFQTAELEQERELLARQFQQLEQESNPVLELRRLDASLEGDVARLRQYMDELDIQDRHADVESASLDADLHALEAELTVTEAKAGRTQAAVDRQSVTSDEVERMRLTRQTTLRQLAAVDKELADTDAQMWTAEIGAAKLHEKFEQVSGQYMKMAQQLQLVGETGEWAGGVDLQMRPSVCGVDSDDWLDTVIKPGLMKLKSQIASEVNAQRDDMVKEEETLEQEKDFQREQEDVLSQLDNQLKRMDANLEQRKDAMQKESRSLHQKLERARDGLLRHKDLPMSLPDCRAALHDERKRQQTVEEARQKETSSYLDFMLQTGQLVVEHKQQMQEQTQVVRRHMEAVLAEELHTDAAATPRCTATPRGTATPHSTATPHGTAMLRDTVTPRFTATPHITATPHSLRALASTGRAPPPSRRALLPD